MKPWQAVFSGLKQIPHDGPRKSLIFRRLRQQNCHRVSTGVLAQRQTHATQISEVPMDLVEIGQRPAERIPEAQRGVNLKACV